MVVVARIEKKVDGSVRRWSLALEREEQWLVGGLKMREKRSSGRGREKRKEKIK